ncbi:MAG: peptide ABC transporter substrate-binding protein, partial [Chlamydiota bacterium]
PFSLACLRDKQEEDLAELRRVFHFFFDHLPLPKANFLPWFVSHLPMIAWRADSLPGSLSIFFLAKKLFKRTEIVFLEEVKQFLLGTREIEMVKFSHQDFALDSFSKERFFGGEIRFLIESAKGAEFAKKSLPFFKETCLKCLRFYQGAHQKNLEWLKLAQIRADLVRLYRRFPEFFGEDLSSSFALFSTLTTEAFRDKRSFGALRRIFLSLEFAKRKLVLETKVSVRLFPVGKRLGVAIAAHLSKYEQLSERQILSAVEQVVPTITSIPASFCCFAHQNDPVQTFYLELKGGGDLLQGRKTIGAQLELAMARRIKRCFPKAFGICFEEEIMKMAAILIREVASCPCHPNIMIFFHGVELKTLTFTLLLVRQKKKHEPLLEKSLQKMAPTLICIPDRIETIGEREVNVFHLQLAKTPDLTRSDGEIRFALARKKVVTLLEQQLGTIRDYNGGLFEKKEQNLTALKQSFPQIDSELIETFFYSLYPVAMQAVLDEKPLSAFFRLFLNYIDRRKLRETLHFFDRDGETFFAYLNSKSADFVSFLKKKQVTAAFPSLFFTCAHWHGAYSIGFWLTCADCETKKRLKRSLLGHLSEWKREKKKPHLRISSSAKSSLDPRRGGDRTTTTLLRALFEGLTRFDNKGKLALALAESYRVSSDQKCYTFTLRRSYWSNGDPVTAHDFEYAWKTALDPSFASDFPELFYCINYAEEAKHGKVSLDKVGVKAKDCYALLVELKYPTPDFLERLAHTLFFPIPAETASKDPDWAEKQGESFISNGPFCLENPQLGFLLNLKKNKHHFRKKSVEIETISVVHASTADALRLFREKKLDFVEIPNRAEGEFAVTAADVGSVSFPAPKISWFSINTSCFPLSNQHLRRALAASISRDELKKLFPCEKTPALTVLPSHLSQHKEASFLIDYNPDQARAYFEAALAELKLTKENFPPIALLVPDNHLRKSIANSLKEKWNAVLGISCVIESHPWREFYKRRVAKQFQLAMVEWGAPTNDPLSTLLAFKTKTDKLNLSAFETHDYKDLLDKALRETNSAKRQRLSARLEEMLIRAACVLPLFYERFWFFEQPNVKMSATTPSFNSMPDFSYFSLRGHL